MNLKQLIKFGLENSSDPVIKNPILRDALEPRSMDQAALSDDLVPGPLKDELEGKFDPSQETYEEYLQRINLERPFNMAEGGQLVAPSVDGSRPGYAGPKKDSNVIAKKINEVNKGFKYYTYDALAKEIPGFNSGNNLQIYIKNNNLSKLESFPKKVEKAWISLFEDGNKSAKTVYKPLIKIRELVGGGQKDYGTGKVKRVRTDAISDALKKSDILVWEDIKPVINKLNSENFIKSLDRKGIDYTIADVEYSAYNKTGMLRAPKTDAEHLMDYVIRHVNQSDSPVYSIYDSKTNKRIIDLKNVDSYHDIYFKSESPFKDTTNYDMEYLKTKARKDPLFKEYFNLQDELLEMKKREYWPDGSRIIDPKTGKGTTFGNWSGSLYKHGYGYTKSFERFPYDTDHKFGVGKHPFKNLAILPQRINIALGSVTQKNRGDLSKKIGADYFRNLSVDDLMMQEKDFGKKILIFDKQGNHVGKKLETPYQNAKRIVKYYNDLDLSKAGRGPRPEFPLSDFQKPDQVVPIEKRLETYKKNKNIDNISAALKQLCPKGKASGGRIGYSTGTPTVACGRKALDKGLATGKWESPEKAKLAKKILQTAGKAGLAGKIGSRIAAELLGPIALASIPVFELGVAGYDTVTAGTPFKEAVNKTFLRYGFGDKWKADPEKLKRKDILKMSSGPEKEMLVRLFGNMGNLNRLSNLYEKQYNLEQDKDLSEAVDIGGYGDAGVSVAGIDKQIKDVENQIQKAGGEEAFYNLSQAAMDPSAIGLAESKEGELLAKRKADSLWGSMPNPFYTSPTSAYTGEVEPERIEAMKEKGPAYGMWSPAGEDYEKLSPEYIKFLNEYYTSEGIIPEGGDVSEYGFEDSGKSILEEEQIANKWKQLMSIPGMLGTQETFFAGGGIAGIRRPNAIPPESGPTPQGLPSMLNRVRRI